MLCSEEHQFICRVFPFCWLRVIYSYVCTGGMIGRTVGRINVEIMNLNSTGHLPRIVHFILLNSDDQVSEIT